MRVAFWASTIALMALVLSACAPALVREAAGPGRGTAPAAGGEVRSVTQALPTPSATPTPSPSPTLLPEEAPPLEARSQFSTDFGKHTAPYSQILSGGPPKDGIPAIDEPRSVTVDKADEWLEAEEPVILVQVEADARAYPIQILMWHEIVNDTVGGRGVTVTYCPLCNAGVAFEWAFDGRLLDFGVTGRLRFSNLIMYDRQTETWWLQATGEGIAGQYAGRQLTFVPASLISWADFIDVHPEGKVLSRDTGFNRAYGQNPYTGYDNVNSRPFLYDGPATLEILPRMARVLTVDLNGDTVAYPHAVLQEVRIVNDTVGGVPLVVLWAPGTASALDAGTVAGGDDVGAVTSFSRELDGRTLAFVLDGDRIVDEQTGSEWDVLGRAVGGPKAGSQLAPVVSINHFWFSWAASRPETRVYSADQLTSEVPSTTPERTSVELDSDFEIIVYQGDDQLGGTSVLFSELLPKASRWCSTCGRGSVPFAEGNCPGCRRSMM